MLPLTIRIEVSNRGTAGKAAELQARRSVGLPSVIATGVVTGVTAGVTRGLSRGVAIGVVIGLGGIELLRVFGGAITPDLLELDSGTAEEAPLEDSAVSVSPTRTLMMVEDSTALIRS
jgi:hypothetical protein